ncbi:MAG TPA: hypothetical protein VH682_23025 [Gemmataceae bacterium]|jgi:hypothetical protein
MSQKLLSAEILAVADALRSVRARLIRLTAEGHLPEGAWPDVSTVQLLGLDVAEALKRLAKGSEPVRRTPGPYDPDERR